MAAKKPARQKHIPQRTCVVCRQTADKRRLIRLVNTPGEGLIIDPTGKRNGRGAYLCDQATCWEQALATDILDKALRATLTATDRERLRAARPAT